MLVSQEISNLCSNAFLLCYCFHRGIVRIQLDRIIKLVKNHDKYIEINKNNKCIRFQEFCECINIHGHIHCEPFYAFIP